MPGNLLRGTQLQPGTVPLAALVASDVANLTRVHFARVVAVANVSSLSGLPTFDGVTLVAGDVALLTAQTTGSQNGLWVVGSGAWTRPSDWFGVLKPGQIIVINPDGTTYKNSKWFCTNTSSFTVDTTATTFTQDPVSATYTNGTGLALSNGVFSVARGLGLVLDGSNNLAIDVTTATGFLRYANAITSEVPSGTVNGSNTSFTLASTPVTGSLRLFLNGQRAKPGSGNDYTISGATITMLTVPQTGDQLLADYNT